MGDLIVYLLMPVDFVDYLDILVIRSPAMVAFFVAERYGHVKADCAEDEEKIKLFMTFKKFKALVEKLSERSIKALRTDRGAHTPQLYQAPLLQVPAAKVHLMKKLLQENSGH
ncbi:hypothetical protein ACH5RR_041357 [Cinchona calisaya]|uniref:Uncharacterized protein n=1 Tax=Cinchona calisaya TaxID=153742 RepID=A0ABD2XYS0_9GENT